MNNTIKVTTEDEFYEKYKPVQNHLDSQASWDGTLYETFGEELNYCFELAKKENRVWTIIECDDMDFNNVDVNDELYEPSCLYIVSGFHRVNRMGFIVTEVPYTEDIEVKLDI